jgi:hypothetical protein
MTTPNEDQSEAPTPPAPPRRSWKHASHPLARTAFEDPLAADLQMYEEVLKSKIHVIKSKIHVIETRSRNEKGGE